MLTRAQVEFLSVEPKVCDQEATLYDLVLKPSAVGSRSRLLAHQQHVLATFGERDRVLASLVAGFWQVGRAWAAMRHAHTVWKLLLRSSQWCARICVYVTRWLACVCVTAGNVRRVTAESACVRRALCVVHTHLCASPMRPRAANTLPNTEYAWCSGKITLVQP